MSTSEKLRLLVVDDNEDNRDMLSRRLRRKGYLVDTAEDGRRALEKIQTQKYALILLDIMMPGISGVDVLKAIRISYSVADLPVIMVTARDQSDDVVLALKIGANDYVTKPLDFSVVLARIQTQLELKNLSELKDEFLRMASHDLKNPLTVVLGGIKLLQRTNPIGSVISEETYEILTRMSKRATEMQRLIEDFLDFQAMQDGQLRLMPMDVNLNDIVLDVVENNLDYADSKEIRLRAELATELPPVKADAARIAQVVQNFVGNAIKFCQPGCEATVRTSLEVGAQVFQISDRGPGLTEEDLKNVFQKYARLSNAPTGGEKSSGLGLAICKRFIDLHGGEIGAYNNPDGGATFWFKLPGPRENRETGESRVIPIDRVS